MRIVALVGASEARGMRLAGFEAFDCADPRELRSRLAALAAQSDVGLVLFSPETAAQAPVAVKAMRGPEPPLAVVLPALEKP